MYPYPTPTEIKLPVSDINSYQALADSIGACIAQGLSQSADPGIKLLVRYLGQAQQSVQDIHKALNRFIPDGAGIKTASINLDEALTTLIEETHQAEITESNQKEFMTFCKSLQIVIGALEDMKTNPAKFFGAKWGLVPEKDKGWYLDEFARRANMLKRLDCITQARLQIQAALHEMETTGKNTLGFIQECRDKISETLGLTKLNPTLTPVNAVHYFQRLTLLCQHIKALKALLKVPALQTLSGPLVSQINLWIAEVEHDEDYELDDNIIQTVFDTYDLWKVEANIDLAHVRPEENEEKEEKEEKKDSMIEQIVMGTQEEPTSGPSSPPRSPRRNLGTTLKDLQLYALLENPQQRYNKLTKSLEQSAVDFFNARLLLGNHAPAEYTKVIALLCLYHLSLCNEAPISLEEARANELQRAYQSANDAKRDAQTPQDIFKAVAAQQQAKQELTQMFKDVEAKLLATAGTLLDDAREIRGTYATVFYGYRVKTPQPEPVSAPVDAPLKKERSKFNLFKKLSNFKH